MPEVSLCYQLISISISAPSQSPMQMCSLLSMHLMCMKLPSPLNTSSHQHKNLRTESYMLCKDILTLLQKNTEIPGPFHERAAYD